MTMEINEKVYVFCHGCNKLLFKGPLKDAVKVKCGDHTITSGILSYINKAYPEVDTTGWEQLQSKRGSLINVRGNVCFPQVLGEREISVIPHCCNNLGVIGAGVALAIKKKWPTAVSSYFGMKNTGLVLGKTAFGMTDDGKVLIANMIGQDGVAGDDIDKPVRYVALMQAMIETLAYARGCAFRGETIAFHCPKFGSDLAGGDFGLITELIKEIWIDAGFDVLIYEFEMDETMWGVI